MVRHLTCAQVPNVTTSRVFISSPHSLSLTHSFCFSFTLPTPHRYNVYVVGHFHGHGEDVEEMENDLFSNVEK